MTGSPHAAARIRNTVIAVSAAAWMLLLTGYGSRIGIAHCPVTLHGAAPLPESFQMLIAMNPPGPLAAGWLLMLGAMMAPVLIEPIRLVHFRSFKRRRARSIALFVAGYAAIWVPVCALLSAAVLAANLVAPLSYLPAVAVAAAAFLWQCSPLKQVCLNRCHAHSELAAFGWAADIAAFRLGISHGVWCAGSCWALMLFPMLLPWGHNAAMAVATVLVVGERIELPRSPAWRLRGIGRLWRIALAQLRLRRQGLRLGPAPTFEEPHGTIQV